MDENTIKTAGATPLLEILRQVADMFPVKDSTFRKRTPLSTQDSEDIADTILYLSKLGVSALISTGAGADDKDPDSVAVQAGPPWRIGLPAKELYTDAAVVTKYEDTLAQILAVLHPKYTRENSTLNAPWSASRRRGTVGTQEHTRDLAHEVVELEQRLAAASPDAEDSSDVTVSISDIECSTEADFIRNTTTQCHSREPVCLLLRSNYPPLSRILNLPTSRQTASLSPHQLTSEI